MSNVKLYTVTFHADDNVETTISVLARNYIDVDRYVRDSREGHVEITAANYKYPIDLTGGKS